MSKLSTARERYNDNLYDLVDEAFAKHALEDVSKPGCWQIGRPGDSMYWAEIVEVARGRLVVHGDIAMVVFQGSYRGRQLMEWAAASHLGYLSGKIVAGPVHTYDRDVAIGDLRARLAEIGDPNKGVELEEAIRALRNGEDIPDVTREIYTQLPESIDWLSDIGKVIDPAVYYAHGALMRLAALLPGEE